MISRRLVATLWTAVATLAQASSAAGYFPLPPPETGDLYVSSYYDDRICVYSQNGQFLRSFTGGGLLRPRGVLFTANGELYVSSQDSDQILVFNPDGQFLRGFTSFNLDGPAGSSTSARRTATGCTSSTRRTRRSV